MLKYHRFTTLKGEEFIVNLNKVLLAFETKRGTKLILEDGSIYEVKESWEYVLRTFSELDLF